MSLIALPRTGAFGDSVLIEAGEETAATGPVGPSWDTGKWCQREKGSPVLDGTLVFSSDRSGESSSVLSDGRIAALGPKERKRAKDKTEARAKTDILRDC